MFRAAILTFSLFATPALAAPHYQAQPVSAPSDARLVVRGTVWNCGHSGCSAAKSNSRPAIVCEALVKEVGALKSFSAGGASLSDEDIRKCNARAN